MSSPQDFHTPLLELISARLSDEGLSDLKARAEAAQASVEATQKALLPLSKLVGRKHLIKGFAERTHAQLETCYGPIRVGEWRLDEAVKVWLLSRSAQSAPEGAAQRLFDVYAEGDTEAKVATLRALNFVKGDLQVSLELVRDAGRTYLAELMQAAWRDSPFSARHLSDEEYRKAVLKALFCDVEIEGFIGLEERADEELSKSLCAYANEREAAGRVVPSALWPVAARFPTEGLVARLIGRLEHPSSEERHVAARALAAAQDPRAEPFITDRLAREPHPDVRAVLERALNR
jgi:hypothetical protein